MGAIADDVINSVYNHTSREGTFVVYVPTHVHD